MTDKQHEKYVERIFCDMTEVGSLPYFYLHGKAEDDNEYDIIGANVDAVIRCLQSCISYCEIVTQANETKHGLIISGYDNYYARMMGYIVYIDDLESLRDALQTHKPEGATLCSHIKLIKELAPEAWGIIQQYNKE